MSRQIVLNQVRYDTRDCAELLHVGNPESIDPLNGELWVYRHSSGQHFAITTYRRFEGGYHTSEAWSLTETEAQNLIAQRAALKESEPPTLNTSATDENAGE